MQNLENEKKELESLTTDNPIQQIRIIELSVQIRKRTEMVTLIMNTRKSSGLDAAMTLIASDEYKQIAGSIRSLIKQMQEEEYRLLEERSKSQNTLTLIYYLTFCIGILIQFFTLYFILYLILKDFKNREKIEKGLLHSRELAMEASRLKSEFLATMSHEIRTPLNGVIGMTGLLSETSLNQEQMNFVKMIRSSGESLLLIINDILDFSKIEAGKMELESEAFNLDDLIEDVLELVSLPAREKGLELVYKILTDVPAVIRGDSARLRQILLNLTTNALKFTEKGEIYIEVSNITKSVATNGELTLQFFVRDSGIGISSEKLTKLFQPFSQGDSDINRKYGGTGLGLVICERLVRLMGGSIRVESDFGKGSSFYFTIQTSADTLEKPKVFHLYENAKEILKGKKALLVDDNLTNLQILASNLETFGMKAHSTSSSFDSLEILEKAEIEIVLSDVEMPEMNGLDLLTKIRSKEKFKKLPVMLLSSVNLKRADIEKIKEFQAIFLTKPVRVKDLHKEILKLFRSHSEENDNLPQAGQIQILSDTTPLKILVADDNLVNQQIAVLSLRKMGYKADLANDGNEAVAAVANKTYDLIFMDLNMPEMNGIDATRQILNSPSLKQKPLIIALTANAFKEDKEKCYEAGMMDFLVKPIQINDLRAIIIKWFKKKEMDLNTKSSENPEPNSMNGHSFFDEKLINYLKENKSEAGKTFFEVLSGIFLESATLEFQQIVIAFKEKDFPKIKNAAHKLNGMSLNIGSQKLSTILEQIQIEAKNENLPLIEKMISDSEDILNRTLVELKRK